MRKIFLLAFLLFFLLPVFSFAQEPVDACPPCSEPGGLVPCGRTCDDPTTAKNECLPCTLCDFFVMIDRWVDRMLDFTMPLLIIMIAGALLLTAYARRGAPETVNKAKRALFGVSIGIAVILTAWAIINSVLMFLGFVNWSGTDDWWSINCGEEEEAVPLAEAFCGDGVVQWPNGKGLIERCDGDDLSFQTCELQGYKSGTLKCLDDCSNFDYSECEEFPSLVYAKPGLPEATPLNPVPLVPAPTGEQVLSYNFRSRSYWEYDACGNTGRTNPHYVYNDYRTWVFTNNQGVEVMKVSPSERCGSDLGHHNCGERIKDIECLNGYILVQPDDLGRCEDGRVVFIRVSPTKATYRCSDYDGHNASFWNYMCVLPN